LGDKKGKKSCLSQWPLGDVTSGANSGKMGIEKNQRCLTHISKTTHFKMAEEIGLL